MWISIAVVIRYLIAKFKFRPEHVAWVLSFTIFNHFFEFWYYLCINDLGSKLISKRYLSSQMVCLLSILNFYKLLILFVVPYHPSPHFLVIWPHLKHRKIRFAYFLFFLWLRLLNFFFRFVFRWLLLNNRIIFAAIIDMFWLLLELRQLTKFVIWFNIFHILNIVSPQVLLEVRW